MPLRTEHHDTDSDEITSCATMAQLLWQPRVAMVGQPVREGRCRIETLAVVNRTSLSVLHADTRNTFKIPFTEPL